MWARLGKQWFLIALAVCFAVGYLAASPLQPLLEIPFLRSSIVFAVMWAMGVTLHAETVRRSLSRPGPSLLAIGINLAVVPLLCLPTRFLLTDDLFGGLFVAAIVPCTLASASVWTRKAGGDDSIAMMTTVATNVACVVVAPLGIWLVLSQQVEIDAIDQVEKLAAVVVAPLVLAQLMRIFSLAGWADRNKGTLSTCAQIGILAMVVFGASASATTMEPGGQMADVPSESTVVADDSTGLDRSGESKPTTWLAGILMVASALLIHLAAFLIGVGFARILGLSSPKQVAVGIAGSQKTLMVGLQIAIDCGVSVVPMLVYHLGQLILDTLIADRWRRGQAASVDGATLPD